MDKCKICGKESKRLGSHVSRAHHITIEEYTLKFEYNNIYPLCKCGCGEVVKWNKSKSRFYDYIMSHQFRDDKIKKIIGEKNSANMKRLLEENPDIVKLKVKQLNSGHTEEVKNLSKQRLIKFNKSEKGRKVASRRSLNSWKNNRETMMKGVKKATETRQSRIESGEISSYNDEWREKISKSITQKYLDGGFEWSRGSYTSKKSGKKFWYRSSWELYYMKDLDNNEDIISWDYEPFSVSYKLEGKKRRYIPDFEVHFKNGKKAIVEIKPEILKDTDMNTEKIKAGIDWCDNNGYEFKIISFEE